MNTSKIHFFKFVKRLASPLIQQYIYLKGIWLFNSIADKRAKIKVMTDEETIDYIIAHRCSISRYGDGEFGIILARLNQSTFDAGFQHYDSKLSAGLGNILNCRNNPDKLLVCIPSCCFNSIDLNKLVKRSRAYWSYYTFRRIDELLKITKCNYLYGDSIITRFYISFKDKSRCKTYVPKLKTIWEGRDIVFVEGNLTHLGYGNDLFSNAKSIRRILCPNKNAWDCYDDILSTVISHTNNDTLIIIALGMTATVLAADLAKAGRQALDLGHIDIEYEWMKMGATEKVPIPGKYVNEVSGGNNVTAELPTEVEQQVIATIGI